jgi:hypothetical protein
MSVCLTAHLPGTRALSPPLSLGITLGFEVFIHLAASVRQHRAMLPLNLFPEHYMFLLTESQNGYAGFLVPEAGLLESAIYPTQGAPHKEDIWRFLIG